MIRFLKKQWQNLLLLFFICLLVIPQTRFPLQVGLQRILSFTPTSLASKESQTVSLKGWSLASLEGTLISPENSTKPLIINVWATWCPPCVAEMPSFNKLYQDYGTKVDFIFISDENMTLQKEFAEAYNLRLPFYQPVSNMPSELQGRQLPTTYVLDRDRRMVVKEIGSANWNSESFRTLLNNLLRE